MQYLRHVMFLHHRLQFFYGARAGDEHGYTTSGYQVHVALVKDEVILGMDMDFTSGKPFLTRLLIHTNLRTLGPYGGTGSNTFISRGTKFIYASGRAGSMVDQLVVFYDRCR